MYFSKNSRYVLQGGQFLSPASYYFSCLKGIDKNLSAKSPKEDPTKPPLRLNIPKDSQKLDTFPSLVQDSSCIRIEPRSRSLPSGPKTTFCGSKIEGNFLPQNEGEIQYPAFKNESISSNERTLKETASNGEISQNVSCLKPETSETEDVTSNYQIKDNFRNEREDKQPLPKALSETNFNSITSFTKDNTNQPVEDNLKSKNNEENTVQDQNAATPESKASYIATDVSNRQTEELAQFAESRGEVKKIRLPKPLQEDNIKTKVKSAKSHSSNMNRVLGWEKSENLAQNPVRKKNKSLTVLSTYKTARQSDKNDPSKKFEVHEIEEVATYVHPLKFKNKSAGAVHCVPEKEINTRRSIWNNDNTPISEAISSRSYRSLAKDVTYSEDVSHLTSRSCHSKCGSKSETGDEDRVKNKSINMVRNFHNSSIDMKSGKSTVLEPPVEAVMMTVEKSSKCYLGKDSDSPCKQACEPISSSQSISGVRGEDQRDIYNQTVSGNAADSGMGATKNYSSTSEVSVDKKSIKVEEMSKKVENSFKQCSRQLNIRNNSGSYKVSDNVSRTFESKVDEKSRKKIDSNNRTDQEPQKGSYCTENRVDVDKKHKDNNKFERHSSDFQTAGSVIKITTEKSSYPMRFSAAYPPGVNEALTNRRRKLERNRDSVFNQKLMKKFDVVSRQNSEFSLKSSKINNVSKLSENSILFPDKENKKFDCDSLFKKTDILNVMKTRDKENSTKMKDNIINAADENLVDKKEQPSVDSLTVMKTVKKIVDLDLKNAIKIFEGREPEEARPVSSVLVTNGEDWEVDIQELEKCVENQKNETSNEIKVATSPTDSNYLLVGTKIEKPEITFDCENVVSRNFEEPFSPKCFPGRKENEIEFKLDEINSVVNYNSVNNTFTVNENELDSAARERMDKFDETLEAAMQTLSKLSKNKNDFPVNLKSTDMILKHEDKKGDSILVFDDETQTWKVDYSIIEKREQQMREEEELIKRSEFILETFEKLERSNTSSIPKPNSPEKRTFDYKKNEWKSYESDKKNTDSHFNKKSTRSKSPFKKIDAEEIRKKNSALYDDLFVVKKDAKMKKDAKSASGLDSLKRERSSIWKLKSQTIVKKSASKNSGITLRSTEPSTEKGPTKSNQSGGGDVCETGKEEDSFWESFLKMDILPQRTPSTRIAPTSPNIPISPGQVKLPLISPPPKGINSKIRIPTLPNKEKKIDDPKLRIPIPGKSPKIEEPKFRIQIPFIGDITFPGPVAKKAPPSTDTKNKINPQIEEPSTSKEVPAAKIPPPDGSVKKKDPKVKAPPSSPSQKLEDPKPKLSEPNVSGSEKKSDPKVKALPSSPSQKLEDPKSKPFPPNSTEPGKKENPKVNASPSTPSYKLDDSKSKLFPPTCIEPGEKEDPEVKAPPCSSSQELEDPKSNPFLPDCTEPVEKEDPEVKVPPCSSSQELEDPKSKSFLPDCTEPGKKEDPEVKTPPCSSSQKLEDPKSKPFPPSCPEPGKKDPEVKAPPCSSSQKLDDPKSKSFPPSCPEPGKKDPEVKAPPCSSSQKLEDPKSKPFPPNCSEPGKNEDPKVKASPTVLSQQLNDSKSKPPQPNTAGFGKKEDYKVKASPAVPSEPKRIGPESRPLPPSIGTPSKDAEKMASSLLTKDVSNVKDLKPETAPTSILKESTTKGPLFGIDTPKREDSLVSSTGTKKEKSLSDHYISEKIVELSKNTTKDKTSKVKQNKVETVKLNISSEKRLPSKITEINLNKKCEEKDSSKDSKITNSSESKQSPNLSSKNEKYTVENKTFYKNFEKYKTPFSDPEYEEKSMKINSDIKSNPNLKKLDTCNKTLVLHDVMKPNENIETWLKDETDKMATLLLKVLQEAAEGNPRKKIATKSKSLDKTGVKGNPYDNIRKKQEIRKTESAPDKLLLKVRSMNLRLENEKNLKSPNQAAKRKNEKSESANARGIPIQSANTVKPPKVIDVKTSASLEKELLHSPTKMQVHMQSPLEKSRTKLTDGIVDRFDGGLPSAEVMTQNKITESELTEEIPGPEFLKKISSAWKMFPVLGCQTMIYVMLKIFQFVKFASPFLTSSSSDKSKKPVFGKLISKYGPIVNLQGPLSGNVVLIHKPEHMAGIFEQDSSVPVRSVFDSVEHCRREAEDKILSAGISTDWSKPEWDLLKKASNDPLQKGCEQFFKPVELAGECLVNNIRRNRNGQHYVSDDFMEEIRRWSIEGLCNVLFEKSFGFLEGRSNQMSWLLEPDKLYVALEEATEYLYKCERGFQMWRFATTPALTGLSQSYRTLSTLLSKQLYQAEVSLKNKNELLKDHLMLEPANLTFIESMLLNDGMTVEEITCNIIDILLIGMNTTSSALGFLFYNLAQNVQAQHKVLKEVKEYLPEKSSKLDYDKLHSLKYLQACLKESLRLHIPIPIFFKVLQNDVLLSNYIVPRGTYVVVDSKVSCFKDQVFTEPDKFVPERWLNQEKWMQNVHPFAAFPFCQGPRADLAKRVIEMQIWSCVAKVIRNYQVEYHFGEIKGTENVISFPDKPLKLNFVERED